MFSDFYGYTVEALNHLGTHDRHYTLKSLTRQLEIRLIIE